LVCPVLLESLERGTLGSVGLLFCPFVCGFASSEDSVTGPVRMEMGKPADSNSP
jgi:hypothetical protein